jgi:hypothetical protein
MPPSRGEPRHRRAGAIDDGDEKVWSGRLHDAAWAPRCGPDEPHEDGSKGGGWREAELEGDGSRQLGDASAN